LESKISSICNSMNIQIDKLLNGVLEGINDIIAVYKPDNTILFYNKSGYEFFKTTPEQALGKRCYNMLCRESKCDVCTTRLAMEKGKMVKVEKYIPELRKYMECTANPVFDENGKLMLIIEQLHDITEEKQELERAAMLQKQRLKYEFPLPQYAAMSSVYIPAKDISGDFYHIHKIDDSSIIGLLGDVSGKGISAALSISAMKVLFYESLQYYNEPMDLINYMNNKITQHFPDEYIAVVCFKLDFKEKLLKVVSAGINEFVIKADNKLNRLEIPGPFLGMFANTEFEESVFALKKDSKLYLYSDGFRLLIEQGFFREQDLNELAFDEVSKRVERALQQPSIIKDDCTLISIDIKEGI
jgi:PAS domain S-box-containing protein